MTSRRRFFLSVAAFGAPVAPGVRRPGSPIAERLSALSLGSARSVGLDGAIDLRRGSRRPLDGRLRICNACGSNLRGAASAPLAY